MRKFWAITGGLVLWLFLAACTTSFNHVINYTTQLERVSASPRIIVASDGGSITARRGADGVVNIDMEKHAPSQDDIDHMSVDITNTDNTVRITYHRPNGFITDQSVAFTISAPADSQLQFQTAGGSITSTGFTQGIDAHTSGGSITATNMTGTVILNTSGGSIDASGIYGSVRATTSGGSITIQGTLLDSNIARTSGGSINVTIPANSNLQVYGSTQGGTVSSNFPLAIDNRNGRGSVSGVIGVPSGSLTMETSGGSIELDRGE